MRWNLLLLVIAGLACQGKRVNHEADVAAAIRALPPAELQKVARKRIYFGHQSVGYNLVEGLEAISRERPDAGLKIVEARTAQGLAGPALAHATNGKNEQPLTKIKDFADTMAGGLGATADVAFFKFCYIDFPPGSDVEGLFAEYKGTLARLRQAYPKVRFVHVTSPLTVVQSGPKALVKKLLGRKLGGAEANLVRERFNALLRSEYQGKEPLFDLAAIESQLPDGSQVTFAEGGRSHPALAPAYASDGKHLNALGARWAAVHLVRTLAALPD